MIPEWPEVETNSVVAIVSIPGYVSSAWISETYGKLKEPIMCAPSPLQFPPPPLQVLTRYYRHEDITQLFGGMRVPVVSPGEVLAYNRFTITSNAPSIPSCCGGVLVIPNSPCFIGIHI